MAYFIFTQNKEANAEWALLEAVERSDLAKEVYKNYREYLDSEAVEMVIVKAPNVDDAKEEAKWRQLLRAM